MPVTNQSFPFDAAEAARQDFGAQLFSGVDRDGAARQVWLEQSEREWVAACVAGGKTELGCVWERRASGGVGELIEVWGERAAELNGAPKADRSALAFTLLRARADAIEPRGAVPGWLWRQAGDFAAKDPAVAQAMSALLEMRPEIGRPVAGVQLAAAPAPAVPADSGPDKPAAAFASISRLF
jgi:hypothetical protein